jgi:transcriptional accessory protein Tex/SPT6
MQATNEIIEQAWRKPYQGFTNCQTWAVFNAINQDRLLQKFSLDIFRDSRPLINEAAEMLFIDLCNENLHQILNFAPWAFEKRFQGVDWSQLRINFERKIVEGC